MPYRDGEGMGTIGRSRTPPASRVSQSWVHDGVRITKMHGMVRPEILTSVNGNEKAADTELNGRERLCREDRLGYRQCLVVDISCFIPPEKLGRGW
jgi:hypothetical protein